MSPVTWNSVPARAWRIRPSAARIPLAAAATVGFFSMARSIASLNVTRMAGDGAVCADVAAAAACTASTASAHRATFAQRSPLRLPFAANAFDNDIENRNEREVQERGGQHAAGDGGADRVPGL